MGTDAMQDEQKREETSSMLGMLYESYTGNHSIYNEEIQRKYRELRAYYQQLSGKEFDNLFSQFSDLCCAHERAAFIEGVRVGVRLAAELEM